MSEQRLRVLLAHPGTQYAPRLAAELARQHALWRFVSGLAVAEDGFWGSWAGCLPERVSNRLGNRRISGLEARHLRVFPWGELRALWRISRGEDAEAVCAQRNEAFQRRIPDHWIREASHVVGFDTSSWLVAERCRKIGRPFLLDQSIGHPMAKELVYRDLRVRYPEWAESVPAKRSADLEREAQEHRDASVVVAPSGFVRDTLVDQGVPLEKIRVNPFGTDLDLCEPGPEPGNALVTFLFAGSLTARKGLPVLLEAWVAAGLAREARLLIIGPGRWPTGVKLPEGVTLLGSLPRVRLIDEMRRADVFVFPSFFEGLAQVQIEAMAVGLPVVGTRSSGAPEIVIEGETGFVVPTGNVESLRDRLCFLARNPAVLRQMRTKCIASRARLARSGNAKRWIEILHSVQ